MNTDDTRDDLPRVKPFIRKPQSVDDALRMLNGPLHLTRSEKVIILQGLWDLAFDAGTEAEKTRLREMAARARAGGYRDFASHVEGAVGDVREFKGSTAEYENPTTAIRRRLEEQQRARRTTGNFTAPWPEHG